MRDLPIHQWQPVIGCEHYSPGCANCKAMNLAPERLRAEFLAAGLVEERAGGWVWNGTVRLQEARLQEPHNIPMRAMILVCPHGDLFARNVPDAMIDRVFDVMDACQYQGFQILTKRAQRMCEFFNARYPAAPPHIAAGVSVERQAEADERLPWLEKTRAAVRYLTVYPVLGLIDLQEVLQRGAIASVAAGDEPERPADPAYIEAIREACAASSVPFVHSSELVGGM